MSAACILKGGDLSCPQPCFHDAQSTVINRLPLPPMLSQRSLCVSNLPPSTLEPELFHFFGAYGALSSVSVVWDCSLEEKDAAGARPRIAFVVMEDASGAAAAIAAPPTIHGRLLNVELTIISAGHLPHAVEDAVSSCRSPVVLHSLSDAHVLAPSVKNLIVVGAEATWQSASDATSILPLLHMLRLPDDAAERLLALAGVDAPHSSAQPPSTSAATSSCTVATTMEQLWTSHRPLQWFNPHALKSTLQLVGVKPSRAEAAVAWIFAVTRCYARAGALRLVTFEGDESSFILSRAKFSTLVRWALCKCRFERGHNLIDFDISSNVRDGQCCVIILLGGTSGTGKSTLAALLSSKLGISTVRPLFFLPSRACRYTSVSSTRGSSNILKPKIALPNTGGNCCISPKNII